MPRVYENQVIAEHESSVAMSLNAEARSCANSVGISEHFKAACRRRNSGVIATGLQGRLRELLMAGFIRYR